MNILNKIKIRLTPYIEFYTRRLLELFSIDKMSKPYSVNENNAHEKLLEYFKKKNGFFIELGGHDGFFHSPTYYLERIKGWKGFLVEPIPLLNKVCKKNRPASIVFDCACVPFDYEEKTITIKNLGHSSFVEGAQSPDQDWVENIGQRVKEEDREYKVDARPLSDLIKEYRERTKNIDPIDLVVLDVEQFELFVLKGLDLKKELIHYLLIECHNSDKFDEISEYLKDYDFTFTEKISHNDYLFSKS